MKKMTKRILSLFLALCMIISVGAIHVFADRKKQYPVYTSFGDSIAAGLGLPDYHTSYDPTSGNLGDGDRIPNSYPDLVATAVGATLNPMARQGYRSNEIRMILDDSYMGDTVTYAMLPSLSPAYAGLDAAGVAMKIKANKPAYVKAIQDADLITVQIGSNDLMESLMLEMFTIAWGVSMGGPTEPAIQQLLNRFGSLGKVYEYLSKQVSGVRQTDTSIGNLLNTILEDENVSKVLSTTDSLAGILNTILNAEDGYKENMEIIAKTINELNPNAKVLFVGLYNPFRDSQLNADIPLKLGHIMDFTLGKMNAIQMSVCNKYDNISFVSDWDAEVVATMNLDEIDVNDQAFFHKISSYVHPNANGHKYIAEQILKALPDEWEGRVVRKNPADKKWYLYDGNAIDYSYTGLAKNEYGWWYVEKGRVNFNYTGFATNQYGTWRVVKSKVAFNENGITGEQKDWRYVKGGKVQNITGVYKNRFGWWYVKDGKVDFSFNGIAQNQYGWWYISGGKVNFFKTGKVTVNKKTNQIANSGTTYRVIAGKVQK